VTGFDDIVHASLSDVGVRRSHNQDNYAIVLAPDEEHWRNQGHVFLVADGMGAHAVGEKASELAASIIPHTYQKYAPQGAVPALRKAFIEANTSIHTRGQQNREFEGMGTTGTMLVLRPEGAWVGHVGDSRAYRIRDGAIEQLSFDHSLVWEYARRQQVDPAEVQDIPSNVIVRSLGPEPLVQVDVEGPHPVRQGDIFVVCSDGLTGQVSDHELGAVAGALPPAEACQFLVDLANLRGGPDNITLLIVRVGDEALTGKSNGTARLARKPWYEMVPWPLTALFLGTLMAGGAIALTFSDLLGAAVPVFLLAAVAIVSGLSGLWSHYAQEKRLAAAQADLPQLQIHHRALCRVERPLLDKLAKAVLAMKQRANEKQWTVSWETFQQHQELAEKHLGQGDLACSFRESCRAMRVLTEALQRHRNKEEVFQPVWDKHAE